MGTCYETGGSANTIYAKRATFQCGVEQNEHLPESELGFVDGKVISFDGDFMLTYGKYFDSYSGCGDQDVGGWLMRHSYKINTGQAALFGSVTGWVVIVRYLPYLSPVTNATCCV